MKYDRSKTFAHPVLRPHNDDYCNSEFQCSVSCEIDSDFVKIVCKVTCSSDDLMQRIGEGRAAFAMVVSCRDTFLRLTEFSTGAELSISRDVGDIRGELRVESYIIATAHIADYFSDDLNPEYGKLRYSLKPGDVLAQDEPTVFYVDREAFKPVTSAVELVCDNSIRDGEWRVDLSEHRVRVRLNSVQKEWIDYARSRRNAKAVLLNSVYFVAVMHAVQAIKDEQADPSLRWYGVVKQQVANSGLALTDDAYLITQRLLRYPLGTLQSEFLGGE